MTQFYAGYNTRLYTAQYDLSAFFNAAEAERSWAELDNTTFGQTAHTRQPGLADGSAKLSGFFSGDANGVRAAMEAALGSAAGEATSLGMLGDALIGNPCYVWLNFWTKGTTKSAVGGLVQTDAEFHARRGGLALGVWAHPNGTETTTGGTAAGIDNGAASATGWRAALHVFSIAGTGTPTLTVKITNSTDDITYADLSGGGFTANTAVGSQYLSSAAATTAVLRYLKLAWTISGSSPIFGFAVSFARLYGG